VSARPQSSKALTGFREIVTAWALAGVMLVILAVLPSHDAGAPAESLAPATAHTHPIHRMPAQNEDRDLLGPCDLDAQDAEPAMRGAHARDTRPWITPEGSDESDEC
jgi:hypothetical protein